ncbi:cysteine proteinase, partial [Metschnikowia bicuspidata]
IVSHEFHRLQIDPLLGSMSMFDLIDYCAQLFEKLVRATEAGDGLRCYTRAYLIFNYFINTFVMLHFNGFSQFMELSKKDFIIYLNLYNFFRSDTSIAPDKFNVHPTVLREWITTYLLSKDMLSFDHKELYRWLDEYIDFMKANERDPSPQRAALNVACDDLDHLPSFEQVSTGLGTVSLLDEDLCDFDMRFPDIVQNRTALPTHASQLALALSVPRTQPAATPYPVTNRVYDAAQKRPLLNALAPSIQPCAQISKENGVEPARNWPSNSPSSPYSTTPNRQTQPFFNGNTQPHDTAYVFNTPPAPHPFGHRPSTVAGGEMYNSPHRSNHWPNQGLYSNANAPQGTYYQNYVACGLKNLGSTCYINLVVQILAGISELFHILVACSKTSQFGELSSGMLGLLEKFKSCSGLHIKPLRFLRIVSGMKPDFRIPNEQQDAQELLLFLLDKLHEETSLKQSRDEAEYLIKWKIKIRPSERDDYLKWYKALADAERVSPINDMFQGHVQNKLKCNKCGHQSISYNPFTILSLPIPRNSNRSVDLTECLQYYSQDEVLSGVNAWNCPKCNKDRLTEKVMDVVFEQKRGLFSFSRRSKSPSKKASDTKLATSPTISIKLLSFIKLPPILFIHLSRFSMYSETDKLHTDIVYPVNLVFNNEDKNISYGLVGYVNHYGSLKSGHYTAQVNKALSNPARFPDAFQRPVWCVFDDDKINIGAHPGVEAVTKRFSSKDVYVLCYQRM